MSDIDLAVRRCKKLEQLLVKGLGASGKGLHEKVSSVESRLPEPLVRKLRKVATIRNKIVHESDYERIDDRSGFKRTCNEAESELREICGGSRIGLKLIVVLAVIIAIIVVVVLAMS